MTVEDLGCTGRCCVIGSETSSMNHIVACDRLAAAVDDEGCIFR